MQRKHCICISNPSPPPFSFFLFFLFFLLLLIIIITYRNVTLIWKFGIFWLKHSVLKALGPTIFDFNMWLRDYLNGGCDLRYRSGFQTVEYNRTPGALLQQTAGPSPELLAGPPGQEPEDLHVQQAPRWASGCGIRATLWTPRSQ